MFYSTKKLAKYFVCFKSTEKSIYLVLFFGIAYVTYESWHWKESPDLALPFQPTTVHFLQSQLVHHGGPRSLACDWQAGPANGRPGLCTNQRPPMVLSNITQPNIADKKVGRLLNPWFHRSVCNCAKCCDLYNSWLYRIFEVDAIFLKLGFHCKNHKKSSEKSLWSI